METTPDKSSSLGQASKAAGLSPLAKAGAGLGAAGGVFLAYTALSSEPAQAERGAAPAAQQSSSPQGAPSAAKEPLKGHTPAPTSREEEAAVPVHPETRLPMLPMDVRAKDQDGNDFELETLKGDFCLLTFGSRTEKDLTLRRLNHLEEIVRQSDRLTNMQYMRAAFFVDEAGETPEELRELLGRFARSTSSERAELRVVGLSGPELRQARAAANAFRRMSPSDKATADHHNLPDKDYATADGTLFLVDPEGAIVGSWDELHDLNTLSQAVAEHIYSYQKTHQSWHGPKAIRRRYA